MLLSHVSVPFHMHPPIHLNFNLQEKELKYTLKLEDMKVKEVETSRFSIGKKFVFALFYTTGK